MAFKDGKRGKADGEGRSDLREARAAEFVGHEAADDDHRKLRDDREQAETNDRDAEKSEGDVLDEWSEGRIGDESPVEMPRVREELELVAMKAVTIVGKEMEEREGRGDGEEDGEIGLASAVASGLVEGACGQNFLLMFAQRSLRSGARRGSVATLAGLGNSDGGHSCGGCCLNAHVGVFKDEAVFGRDAEACGGGEECVGSGLGARVVLGADEDGEAIEQTDGGERLDDGLAAAAGDDGEGNVAVLGDDVLEHLRNGLEVGKQLEVKVLFALGNGFDGHVKALHLVQRGDDFDRRLAAPGVEEIFVESATPFAERLLPGDVVQRHGVDDGAVAVEEIGAESAGGNLKSHQAPWFFLDQVRVCTIPPQESPLHVEILGWGNRIRGEFIARRRARAAMRRLRRAWSAPFGARC